MRGDRTDLNGPFLARSLLSLGIEPAEVRVVADTPEELVAAFESGLGRDLVVVSGGLGPTHDDRTVELLARVAGRPLVLDSSLELQIGARSRLVAERLHRPYGEFAPGVRKQATVPQGAISAGLAGTAPALVLDLGGCIAVTLPGPPRELQELWPRVLETAPLRRLLEQLHVPQRRVLRFFGVGESTVAQALASAGGDGRGIEMTICAREFEIHVDLFVEEGAESRADQLEAAFTEPLEPYLFGRSEAPIEKIVLELCRRRGLTLATAESCTGGLVAARLTSVPGSSDVFLGGIVSYADEVKQRELGVPASVLLDHGAVSAETAASMALGGREALGADLAVAVTGIAGPGGGSDEKPVGLVFLHASGSEVEAAAEFSLPGDRDTIRRRATVAALHLLRRAILEAS